MPVFPIAIYGLIDQIELLSQNHHIDPIDRVGVIALIELGGLKE